MGVPNTAQGPAAVRFAPYIKELQEFFASASLRYGSPENIVPLIERIDSSQPFATDLGSMVRSIVFREGGEMAHSQLLEILALAIGGEELNRSPQQYGQSLRKLLSFMSGVLRKPWNEPPGLEGAADVPAESGDETTPEDAPTPTDTTAPGGAAYSGFHAHRGEVLPFPTNPRPGSGRGHGQAAAISAAAERAAHAAGSGDPTRRPPALSFVPREPGEGHASREYFTPYDFAGEDEEDQPLEPSSAAGRFAYWRSQRKQPGIVGEPKPPERSTFDPHMAEDHAVENPELEEFPPEMPSSGSSSAEAPVVTATTPAPAFSTGLPHSSEAQNSADHATPPTAAAPAAPHIDRPSWQLAAEAARGDRLEPLPVATVAPPSPTPAPVLPAFTAQSAAPPESPRPGSEIPGANAAVGPFHETHLPSVFASPAGQNGKPTDTAFSRGVYVPHVPRSPAGILVAAAAVLVVAGIVFASLQPAPTELTGKHPPAASSPGTPDTSSIAESRAKPTAQGPAVQAPSATVPPQKLLRVHQVTESDEEDADESDVAAPYSTPIPGQPTPAKPSPYDSSSQRAGAQGIQSANGQQPAPVVRTSAPPSNEVASASVPPPPGESSQEYSSERYAGAQPGTVGQPGLHPGVTSSYRDPDAAIAGDLPRSGRGSRGVVPQNPDEVEVSSGIMAGYLISAPRPDYPTLARLAHIGGPVVLQAVIAKNGTVLATHVLSGHRLLRGAAEDAVRRWRFRPYVVDGHPVEVSTIITLRFRQKR